MFFVLSKVLQFFVYPFPLFFLVLVAVVVGYHRRGTRWVLAGVLVVLYGLSAPVTVWYLVHWLEIPRRAPEALGQRYDLAIVLTGMVNLGLSTPSVIEFNGRVDRILAGIDLVQRGAANKVLIAGGTGDVFGRLPSEAKLLQTFVLKHGLTADQVLVEPTSRNTYESAVNVAQMLRASPSQRLVLVTSSFHMRRAAAVFRKQGLSPDLYPTDFHTGERRITPLSFIPDASALAATTLVVHELVGLVMYRFQGYI
jgi:uncharacterized SAM-binding protein YcdF (DUF218 family)